MPLTNSNSDFATWFKQLELLAKKMGCGGLQRIHLLHISKKKYYDKGYTPDQAIAKDLE